MHLFFYPVFILILVMGDITVHSIHSLEAHIHDSFELFADQLGLLGHTLRRRRFLAGELRGFFAQDFPQRFLVFF